MTRFTNPTLAHGELTNAVYFLKRDLHDAYSAAAAMSRHGLSIPAPHMSAMREAHAKLGQLLTDIENTEDGRTEAMENDDAA